MTSSLEATAKNKSLRVCKALNPLSGKIHVPGDKSISHRALMLASLAYGTTNIQGLLEGQDVLCTARAMKALGAEITRKENHLGAVIWRVKGCGAEGLHEASDVLDMGNSGTATRLLSGILATYNIKTFLTGDQSLRSRPMKRIIDPLSKIGTFFYTHSGNKLPMVVDGVKEGLAITYRLPVASAQVKSAILLAGLNCHGTTIVEEPVLTRNHTENMLRHFGVDVQESVFEDTGKKISLVGPARLNARDIIVPGDPSSASFLVVAALLIPGSDIIIENLGLNRLRTGLFKTLKEMGGFLEVENRRIEAGEDVGDLHVKASSLHAIDVPGKRAPSMIDEYPILAVACAMAQGESHLHDLEELKVKECDRLNLTADLLRVNGIDVKIVDNDLIIHGIGDSHTQTYIPGGGKVKTEMDHRLAMSGIILGLVSDKPVEIDDIRFIETSFPTFITLMNEIGADI